MNHQPFESWLLSEDTLSPEKIQELEIHLSDCKHCRQLQHSLNQVVDLFQGVPEVEPAPGFVDRWNERLAVEKQINQVVRNRWQSMIMLILIGNVIAALVFLLGTQFLTTFDTPLSLFLAGISRLASMVAFVNTTQNILLTIFRTMISVVPVGIWALLGAGLVGSGAIWFISITSLSALPKRI